MPDGAEQAEQRPAIAEVQSGSELRRWYWLKTELVDLARLRGVRTSGGKVELTDRLAAHLDGLPQLTPARAAAPPRANTQLAGSLTADTVIPPGQRSSQALRVFFTEAIGPQFRFDGPMRDFIASGAGKTLGDAIAHWHATRDQPRTEIAPQFELNRFVRAWHEAHPDGTREQAIAAWHAHRALPIDRRG